MAPFRGQRPKASLMLALSLLLWPGLQLRSMKPTGGPSWSYQMLIPCCGKGKFPKAFSHGQERASVYCWPLFIR